MQIKKPTRDAQFPGAPRYEHTYGVEPRDAAEEPIPEAFSVRHARSAEGAAASDTPDVPQSTVRSQSVIDRHSSFDGQFETEHDLRVEGTIAGEVICRGLFTIEREATARVRVQARDAHVQGRLEGDIVCTGKLLLSATAHVTGTLKAAVLVVEEGATLSGNVDTTQAPGTARPAPTAARNGDRETPAPAAPKASRRDLPSFAIVTSDDRAAGDRN